MRWQAGSDAAKIATYNAIISDDKKSALAFAEFEANNADGKYRKRLIDWGHFQKNLASGLRSENQHQRCC